MGSNETSLRITAWAIDKASPTFKEIQKATSKLPESFAKASSALSVLGGAANDMGGPIAAATGKLSQFGSLIATGGPLGLGIAAATLAVGLMAKTWEALEEPQRQAESAARSLSGVFQRQAEEIEKASSHVQTLEEKLRNFGKTATETEVAEAQRAMRQYAVGIELAAREAAQLEEQNKKLSAQTVVVHRATKGWSQATTELSADAKEQIALNNVQIEGFKKTKANLEALTEAARKQADLAQQLDDKQKEAEASRKAREDAKAAAAKRAKDDHAEGLRRADDLMKSMDAEGEAAKKLAEQQIELEKRVTEAKRKAVETRIQIASNYSQRMMDANAAYFAQVEAEYTARAQETLAVHQAVMNAASGVIIASTQAATDSLMTATAAWVSGAESAKHAYQDAGKAVVSATLAAAKQVIIMAAAEAAARAIAANSGIPIVGIAVAATAAAAVFALAMKYSNKFAKGGVVTGGREGEDSVPALLTPGEVVLSVPQVRQLRAVLAGTGVGQSAGMTMRFADGGTVPSGGGGGGNMNVQINNNMAMGLSPAQMEKLTRHIARALHEMHKNHRLRGAAFGALSASAGPAGGAISGFFGGGT